MMALLLRGARRWARPPAQPALRWLSSPPAAAEALPKAAKPLKGAERRLLQRKGGLERRPPPDLPKDRIFKIVNLKTSAQKVGIVARLVNVRGLRVREAADHLKFLPQKAAVLLRGVLELALRRGPIENHMDPNRMVIGARAARRRCSPPAGRAQSARSPRPCRPCCRPAESLWSGRCTYLRRADFKAKGRMGTIKKPRTTLYARVREAAEEELSEFRLRLKKGVPDRAAYRRERRAERPAPVRAHQQPRVNFWPLS